MGQDESRARAIFKQWQLLVKGILNKGDPLCLKGGGNTSPKTIEGGGCRLKAVDNINRLP
ncbi:hypothetical protein NHP214376_05320 [Helicobacter ailurogastricus]|nr:hypothetical protein NHP214376_05320 [Helicobacter ailurogastricus]GLH58846.1 hypothetical protein NHP214377_01100 [Helicobacter ailurogastricus]